MSRETRAVCATLLIGAMLAAACVTPRMAPELLPEDRIAFVHWDDKAASKRGEIFAKIAEAPPIPPDDRDPERLEETQIRAFLQGDQILQIRSQLQKHPGRLSLLNPRADEIESLEAAPRGSIPLAWSPDRERLLIASSHRGDKEQLYEYNLARRDLAPVTFGPEEHPRGGYAADGTLYVERVARVTAIGPSAMTVHRLEQGGRLGPALAEGVPPSQLRLLGQAEGVVFEQIVKRPRRNGPTVFESFVAVAGFSGAEPKLLLRGREPVMTPDGQWIVFASPSTAGYRLRRMRPDGTSRVPIGPGGTEERMPAVSPDGAFVAFVQTGLGRRRLAVRSFDGKDERVLIPTGWSEFPVW